MISFLDKMSVHVHIHIRISGYIGWDSPLGKQTRDEGMVRMDWNIFIIRITNGNRY
jgi:hypothetical protein